MHLHEILTLELARFGDGPIRIVETGTIRGDSEHSRTGDGWSTEFFAKRIRDLYQRDPHAVASFCASIDLDCRVAQTVLERLHLDPFVTLITAYSITGLMTWAHYVPGVIDVVLLDSDNDATLIFSELLVAMQIVRPGGLILIDDVRMKHHPEGAKKGDKAFPWIAQECAAGRGAYRLHERTGWNGYKCGVLAYDVPA